MNILFEINHPAQGHLFKHVIRRLISNGHSVKVIIKGIPVLQKILAKEHIPFIHFGKKGVGLFNKFFRQLGFLYRIHKLHRRNNFDVGVGVSVTLPVAGKLSSMASVVLDDDDKKATPLFAMVTHPLASVLMRPAALAYEGTTKNTIYYKGYHELAYLHPNHFKPDIAVLKAQGFRQNEQFFLVRLVALKAHHDAAIKGISSEQATMIVKQLKKHGRVIITQESEAGIPAGAESLKIDPADIHHLMAFAKLVVSDGQTMCSEAACLGVPSVRINDFVGRISYLEEQEKKWQLIYGFKPVNFNAALHKIEQIISEDSEVYKTRRNRMLSNSIDVTAFLVWFIENWPESFGVMKEKPEYQWRFR